MDRAPTGARGNELLREGTPRDETSGTAPVHSLFMVSCAVEVWRQAEVIHCGSARIDRVVESRP